MGLCWGDLRTGGEGRIKFPSPTRLYWPSPPTRVWLFLMSKVILRAGILRLHHKVKAYRSDTSQYAQCF